MSKNQRAENLENQKTLGRKNQRVGGSWAPWYSRTQDPRRRSSAEPGGFGGFGSASPPELRHPRTLVPQNFWVRGTAEPGVFGDFGFAVPPEPRHPRTLVPRNFWVRGTAEPGVFGDSGLWGFSSLGFWFFGAAVLQGFGSLAPRFLRALAP